MYLFWFSGRWLVAALQTVQRSWVTAFPTENESSWFLENQKKKTLNIKSSENLMQNNIIRCDEVPLRLETDPNLKNRKVVTQIDYLCSISSRDMKRVAGENLPSGKSKNKIEKNQNSETENTNVRSTGISLSKIRNKLSNIKNSVIQQISNQGATIKTRFVWFDYHKKCKNGNINALKEIFPTVKDSILGTGGYFECIDIIDDKKSLKLKDEDTMKFAVCNVQNNIVRTNCIDCLDRTNVVQTTVARWALNHQLRSLGVDMAEGGVGPDSMSLPNNVRTHTDTQTRTEMNIHTRTLPLTYRHIARCIQYSRSMFSSILSFLL
jgi:hypothetical protein